MWWICFDLWNPFYINNTWELIQKQGVYRLHMKVRHETLFKPKLSHPQRSRNRSNVSPGERNRTFSDGLGESKKEGRLWNQLQGGIVCDDETPSVNQRTEDEMIYQGCFSTWRSVLHKFNKISANVVKLKPCLEAMKCNVVGRTVKHVVQTWGRGNSLWAHFW